MRAAIGWTRTPIKNNVHRFSDVVVPRTTLQARIDEAKKSVFISGVTLVATLSTSFDDCVKNNIDVKILMLRNNDDLIAKMSKLSYATADELRQHINTTLNHFKLLRTLPKIKIKSIDSVVPFGLVGIDIEEPYGKIYVQQYLYKTYPISNPNYICYSGEDLYDVYCQQIKSLWDDSVEIDF